MSTKSNNVANNNFQDTVGTGAFGRDQILRSIVLAGIFISVVHLIIQSWFINTVLKENPFVVVLQYIASGIKGLSAFQGGNSDALLGVLIHVVISFVVAAVFILLADRIPFLRRYAIPAALLYGFGVWFVMQQIIVPLSATPPIPAPTTPYLIEEIVEHILVVGLPLGILVQRNSNTKN